MTRFVRVRCEGGFASFSLLFPTWKKREGISTAILCFSYAVCCDTCSLSSPAWMYTLNKSLTEGPINGWVIPGQEDLFYGRTSTSWQQCTLTSPSLVALLPA